MRKVGLVRADESYDAVRKALDLIRDRVTLPQDRPILIKPNMVVRGVELCATPVGAVSAALEFLSGLGARDFIIAEGTGTPDRDTLAAFREYGNLHLAARLPVAFCYLHHDEKVLLDASDADLNAIPIRVAKRLLTSYVVSVARIKTHLRVVATLTMKNTAVAAIHHPATGVPIRHVARGPRAEQAGIVKLYPTADNSISVSLQPTTVGPMLRAFAARSVA